MTKKSIYTLFFTTILSSGILFAADDMASPDVREKIAALKGTPDLRREAVEKYPTDVFSPGTAEFLARTEVTRARQTREDTRDALEGKLRQKELRKETEASRAKAEEESARQLADLRAKITGLTLKLTADQQSRIATEEGTARLSAMLAELKAQQTEMAEQIAAERKRKEELEAEQARMAAEMAAASSKTTELEAERVRMAAQIEAEKRKKLEVISASSKAIEDLEASMAVNRARIMQLTTDLSALKIERETQAANAAGLTEQIKLYEGLLATIGTTDSETVTTAAIPPSTPVGPKTVPPTATGITAPVPAAGKRVKANFGSTSGGAGGVPQ